MYNNFIKNDNINKILTNGSQLITNKLIEKYHNGKTEYIVLLCDNILYVLTNNIFREAINISPLNEFDIDIDYLKNIIFNEDFQLNINDMNLSFLDLDEYFKYFYDIFKIEAENNSSNQIRDIVVANLNVIHRKTNMSSVLYLSTPAISCNNCNNMHKLTTYVVCDNTDCVDNNKNYFNVLCFDCLIYASNKDKDKDKDNDNQMKICCPKNNNYDIKNNDLLLLSPFVSFNCDQCHETIQNNAKCYYSKTHDIDICMNCLTDTNAECDKLKLIDEYNMECGELSYFDVNLNFGSIYDWCPILKDTFGTYICICCNKTNIMYMSLAISYVGCNGNYVYTIISKRIDETNKFLSELPHLLKHQNLFDIALHIIDLENNIFLDKRKKWIQSHLEQNNNDIILFNSRISL